MKKLMLFLINGSSFSPTEDDNITNNCESLIHSLPCFAGNTFKI